MEALHYNVKVSRLLLQVGLSGWLSYMEEGMDKTKEIEKELDRTFKRNCMADDDDETPLRREVFALEEAVREILKLLGNFVHAR